MKRFRFKWLCVYLCWLSVFFVIEPAVADIIPDSKIMADLKKLFIEPPDVQGYPYQHLIATAAARYNLPLPFVLAVVRGESFFDPRAKSAKGALGLMQVLPSTAADYGLKPEDLLDPVRNIDVGVHYLADLYAQLQDPYLTLAAYYCGCGGINKEEFTLRKDCDEYVQYIHRHLQKIMAEAGGKAPTGAGLKKRFEITRFDNYLDAEQFLGFLSRKLSNIHMDIFRQEVVYPDHNRYQYQILAAYGQDQEKDEICVAVKTATGFSFCIMN
jgi:hypothetical protein